MINKFNTSPNFLYMVFFYFNLSFYLFIGNVLKGWDGMKNKVSKYQTKNKPKKEEMLFSGSSSTTNKMQF